MNASILLADATTQPGDGGPISALRIGISRVTGKCPFATKLGLILTIEAVSDDELGEHAWSLSVDRPNGTRTDVANGTATIRELGTLSIGVNQFYGFDEPGKRLFEFTVDGEVAASTALYVREPQESATTPTNETGAKA